MWRNYHENEDGVALFMALLGVIVLSGLAILFTSRAITESRQTGSERDFENAIHVAEAGVDHVIVDLNDDDELVTSFGGSPHHYDADGDGDADSADLTATQDQETQWAVDVARTSCTLVSTQSDGEACGIRPQLDDGTALPWVFGVGFVPDRANPVKTRVIKIEWDKGFFSPQQAILTNGNLNFGGDICGVSADVHSNGTVTLSGGADTTSCADPDGNVTGSDGYVPAGGSATGPDSGHTPDTVFTLPPISARSVRDDEVTTHQDEWYELCYDASGVGTVRRPYTEDGAGTRTIVAPCQGDILWTEGQSAHFRGWRLEADSGNPPRGAPEHWRAGGGAFTLEDGVYYVHELNASVEGNISGTPQLTVLADGKGDINPGERPDTGSGCTLNGRDDGNIFVTGLGGGDLNPLLKDLMYLADRDIVIAGNSSSEINGVLAAHEQIDAGGTAAYTGALLAEDACNTSSFGSPVDVNSVGGNFQLTHNGDLLLPLDSVVRITAWNEI
ncbi:MAG: hypothetical protein KY469_12815 [Actinobacteria bacterium]|nr:hypothetical protein [Actinomycetota bacterium]